MISFFFGYFSYVQKTFEGREFLILPMCANYLIFKNCFQKKKNLFVLIERNIFIENINVLKDKIIY